MSLFVSLTNNNKSINRRVYFSDIDEVHKIPVNCLFNTTITATPATICFNGNTLNIQKF